jgi:cytochrome c oxidase subunit IV
MADTHHNTHSKGYDNDQSPYDHPDVHLHHDESKGSKIRKKIWQVFWILFAITAVEFIIAFVLDRGAFRNMLFIGLTLVKAGYIVAVFMHLKDEIRSLMMTILIPLAFVLWLILCLLIEGGFYGKGWFLGL